MISWKKTVLFLFPPLRRRELQIQALLKEKETLLAELSATRLQRDDLVSERNTLGALRYQFEHERDMARSEVDRLSRRLDRQASSAFDTPIIFQHLAKTAGTTLGDIFQRAFAVGEQLAIDGGRRTTALGTWLIDDVTKALECIGVNELERIRFVGGHLPFGVHDALPFPAKYVSFVRDPVERVLSGYYYCIERHRQETGEAVSLHDYVFRKRHYDLGLDNYCCRVMSGLKALDPCGRFTTENTRAISDDDFSRVLQNIEAHYSFIGVTERFDESLVILAKLLGWNLSEMVYARRNEVVGRPQQSGVDKCVVDEIKRRNKYDYKLYAIAKNLLSRAIASYGPDFKTHLGALRAMNLEFQRGAYCSPDIVKPRTLSVPDRSLQSSLSN